MTADTASTASLCSGYGGLDMAVRLARSGDLRETWFCEVEGHDPGSGEAVGGPSLVLAKRYPDAPNHGDMTAVNWSGVDRPYRVTAGFPCQGASVAGKRLGRADRRWLWPAVETCLRTVRPAEVFVENVANLLRIDGGGAFGDVLTDLHALGYDCRWAVVGACAAGLSHHRHRLFVLATRVDHTRRRPGRRKIRPVEIASYAPVIDGWLRPDGSGYVAAWPPAGSMVDGRIYADTPVPCGAPVRRKPVASGTLLPTPTPTRRDGDGRGEGDVEYWARRAGTGRVNGMPLGAAVGLLPTPTSADSDRTSLTYARGNPSLVGALLLLPTPVANDTGRSADAHLAMRAGMDASNRTSVSSLAVAAQLLPTPRAAATRTSRRAATAAHSRSAPSLEQAIEIASGVLPREITSWGEVPASWQPAHLLPTPAAGNFNDGEDLDQWRARRAAAAERHGNNGFGVPLSVAARLMAGEDRWGQYTAAVVRQVLVSGACPPEPTEPNKNGNMRLAAPFPEWMMSLPPGWVTDVLGRNAALKAVGNGVAPMQGALAYRLLAGYKVPFPEPAAVAALLCPDAAA